jgi:dihydroorotase
MTMPFDLVLRGGRVIDPSQKLDAVTDVGFAAGWGFQPFSSRKADNCQRFSGLS